MAGVGMSDAQTGVKTPFQAPPGADSEEYAKSSPPLQTKSYDSRLVRAERYWLLAAARGLLFTEGRRQRLEFPNKVHATTKCKYIHREQVRVLKSKEHDKAFFSGLVTCGSVWSCTVCSVKIQERRRLEIAKGIEWAYANGLQPVMVTLTFPHNSWDSVRNLLDGQKDALTRLRKGAAWDRFKGYSGYEGLIRALELTHGQHGWHPHTHEVWFVSRDAVADLSTDEARAYEAKKRGCSISDLDHLVDMKTEVIKRWEIACKAAGMLDDEKVAAFRKHAVDVKGWCSASDYLAKMDDAKHWGIDREMAKATSKAGKAKGMHPFGLLAEAAEGNTLAGYRFVEYSLAVKGRAQLFWSRGLKKRVGIEEKTDEEVADEETDKADSLGPLTDQDWILIRATGSQAKVLDAAEDGGWPAIMALLQHLAKNASNIQARGYANLAAEQEGAKVLKTAQLGDDRRRRRTKDVELTP